MCADQRGQAQPDGVQKTVAVVLHVREVFVPRYLGFILEQGGVQRSGQLLESLLLLPFFLEAQTQRPCLRVKLNLTFL